MGQYFESNARDGDLQDISTLSHMVIYTRYFDLKVRYGEIKRVFETFHTPPPPSKTVFHPPQASPHASKFEDRLKGLVGGNAFHLYTVDKLCSAIAKQVGQGYCLCYFYLILFAGRDAFCFWVLFFFLFALEDVYLVPFFHL